MACGATRQPTRTELIDVPVTQYAPIPAALTDPIVIPAPPVPRCKLAGQPAPCALDTIVWAWSLRDLLDRANADRAAASRLGREAAAADGLIGRDDRAEP
jgi:hypothetical protein